MVSLSTGPRWINHGTLGSVFKLAILKQSLGWATSCVPVSTEFIILSTVSTASLARMGVSWRPRRAQMSSWAVGGMGGESLVPFQLWDTHVQLLQSSLCRDLHCVLVRLGDMMVPGQIEAWHGLGLMPRLQGHDKRGPDAVRRGGMPLERRPGRGGAGPEWLCWGWQAFELP